MKGFLKVEAVEKDGKEGISVQCDMTEVSLPDRLSILDGVATSLRMTPMQLQMFCDMRRAGVFGEAETIYDHSSKNVPPVGAERSLGDLLDRIFGGGVLIYADARRRQ